MIEFTEFVIPPNKGINDVKEYYKMVKAIKSRRKRDGYGR